MLIAAGGCFQPPATKKNPAGAGVEGLGLGAAEVSLDFSWGVRRCADSIPNSQKGLCIHLLTDFKDALVNACVKLYGFSHRCFAVKDVRLVAQPGMFMRLNPAGRIAEVVGPRGNGHD
ncbi:hypothetical protein JAO82_00510 [Pontibaca sp. S1109L]|uniref:Uncharacterized protein n=1 Tax=Pontibaca salina TaxID=2795731 RepID=A0A934HPT2_9RHOB|nr:hypothetical protein [Pontibaca salina]